MTRPLASLTIAALLFSSAAAGAQPAPPVRDPDVAAAAAEVVDAFHDPKADAAVEVGAIWPQLVATTAARQLVGVTKLRQAYIAETARTDKQLGATASSSGSTTVAEKPGLAWLFAAALETGAIQQEHNKTGVTLTTSPYAFLTLSVPDTPDTYDQYALLRRFAIAATFPTDSGGSAESRNFDASTLSELSARVALIGDRSTRSREFNRRWDDKVAPLVRQRLVADTQLLMNVFERNSALKIARDEGLQNAKAAIGDYLARHRDVSDPVAAEEIANIIDRELARIRKLIVEGAVAFTDPQKRKIGEALGAVVAVQDNTLEEQRRLAAIVADVQRSPLLTLAYTYHRNDEISDTSEVKLLGEYSTDLVNVVGNAGAAFNHEHDAHGSTVHDYSFSVSLEKELDNFLPRVNDNDQSKIVLSLTGRFEHLEGEHDDIGVGQAKIVIPIAGGVSFPISVTYASRSEQVDESEVRGNFGFTFDAEKLYALTRSIAKPAGL